MSLAIKLTADQERLLAEIAQRLNVSPASLAEAAVRELVAQPDDDLDRVSRRILEKNRERYGGFEIKAEVDDAEAATWASS